MNFIKIKTNAGQTQLINLALVASIFFEDESNEEKGHFGYIFFEFPSAKMCFYVNNDIERTDYISTEEADRVKEEILKACGHE